MRFPTSLAARVGAVAAAAAIAVTGVTTAASAATAAPASIATVAHTAAKRIPTTLAISNTLPRHKTAIINGHLTAGTFNLRHLRVWLLRKGFKGHWYVAQTKLTERFGHVLFWVHVGKNPVKFRLAFRGNRNFAPSLSSVVTIP
jgi:hypothetical protein